MDISFSKATKKLDNQLFGCRATNQNDLLELLENVNEIKINNIANKRRWKWELSRFKIYGLRVKNMNLDQIEATGASFIIHLQGLFITYIAALNVIEGTMDARYDDGSSVHIRATECPHKKYDWLCTFPTICPHQP